jgi:hypothetical protein
LIVANRVSATSDTEKSASQLAERAFKPIPRKELVKALILAIA